MQEALLRIDEAAEGGRARPLDAKVAEYLGRHYLVCVLEKRAH
jgi:hypothetical protein